MCLDVGEVSHPALVFVGLLNEPDLFLGCQLRVIQRIRDRVFVDGGLGRRRGDVAVGKAEILIGQVGAGGGLGVRAQQAVALGP